MMNTTPLLEGTGLSVVEYKGLATWGAALESDPEMYPLVCVWAALSTKWLGV